MTKQMTYPALSQFQTLDPRLGAGFSSNVSLVQDPATRAKFALKSVSLTRSPLAS